jgi:raffinose/stachyose/melibiose transport system permease protein
MKRRFSWGRAGLFAAMVVVALAVLTPIAMVANTSFKTKKELYVGNPLALPQEGKLDNYLAAGQRLHMETTFVNTVLYTVVSVVVLGFLSAASAWVIARNRSRFYRFTYLYFVVGLLVPFQALFLPIYIIGFQLHLTNTAYGIVLMYVATGLPFGIFLMTSFMTTVPLELEEAAKIDGCSVYRTFFQVVFPLLQPAVATLIILQAFGIWNDYLLASLYVSETRLKTLTVFLQQLFSSTSRDYNTAMAAIVVSTTPIVVLFVFLQKYFIKGLAAGAVKG